MKKFKGTVRKAASALLSAGLGLSLVQIPVYAMPASLVNRANDFTITVPSAENGHPASDMVDGDLTSLWVNNGAKWPCQVTFHAPLDAPTVYKAVVHFESGHPDWSVDVRLTHLLNGMTEEVFTDKEETGHKFNDTFEVVWEDGISPSSLTLELSNPKNGTADGAYWPGIAEVELFTEKEGSEPSQQINVAPRGSVSANMVRDTPSNLIDENYDTLYVFSTGMAGTPNPWVQVSLDQEYEVTSIETAFEKKDPDASQFEFTFDILGRAAGSEEWTELVTGQKATRLEGGNIQTLTLPQATKLKDVRVRITSITNTGGDPWPALAELKIFASAGSEEVDEDNILTGKTAHSNYASSTLSRICDGNLNTVWEGDMYPCYIDFDLGENYFLSDAIVYTPVAGYSQYSIYTSLDGQKFDRVVRKTSHDAADNSGESWPLQNKEARYIRLYPEYNSNSTKAQIREFVVHGIKGETPLKTPKAISVKDFNDTDFAAPVTEQDTIGEVQGIIERRLGKEYVDWFTFELADQANGYDYYDLSAKDGKIHIKGNNGVSLATGLNGWLKEFAKINISQVSEQVKMPASIILPDRLIHKETRFPVRYSYNFCTLSYSMAFWGEVEWREELDWLALNGVNVVLDATGEEEVWRRFLSECGYSHQEIKDYLTGPAYVAWFYMANMTGFGGPLPDEWFEQRTELARTNHRIMQVLGMQPVLQGFSGMVPVDFATKQPDAKVIAQGKWNQFQRPYMLKTDDANTFDKYARMFYKHQKDVFGDITDYYATDPFHEGGNTGGMNVTTIAQQTLKLMMESDPDAVWVIQAWQGNPTNALLAGLEGNRDHALVLDLYAERTPHWNGPGGSSYGPANEFNQTPWVYCMLNNFGGRLGLHGYLDTMNEQIPYAANNSNKMAGVGITPEGSQNNPILYEFIFDSIWTENASTDLGVIDLESWIDDYSQRRYGASSESAQAALNLLADTVYSQQYNPPLNSGGSQGAPEDVVNARPALNINAASTWGYSTIRYEKKDLEKALKLLLEDYDLLKDSQGYQYDVVNVAQQVLSNTAQEYLSLMNAAYSAGDQATFAQWSDKFLTLIDVSDQLLSTQKKFLLGNWTEAAGRMIANPDDFTKDVLDLNAKALVTTWGSINQCNAGGLKDYSNRQWAGLTGDLYKNRWQLFIDARKKELAGESASVMNDATWFEMEWEWARDHSKSYTDQPADLDIQALAQNVLDNYSVQGLNPATDDSRDLEPAKMTAAAGSAQTANGEIASNVLDGDPSTMWHSAYNGATRDDLWIEFDLDEAAEVDGLRYQPRASGPNGVITAYRIEYQEPDSTEWKTAAEGTWVQSSDWKIASFEPVTASKVRLIAVDSASDQTGKVFASAREIRLTGEWSKKYTVVFHIDGQTYTENEVSRGTLTSTLLPENAAKEGYILTWTPALAEKVDGDAEYTAIYTVDKTPLSNRMDELAELVGQESVYTPESWKAWSEAKTAAQDVLNNAAATPAQVQQAVSALNAAWSGLVRTLDYSLLNSAISKSDGLDLASFARSGQTELEAALNEAKEIVDNAASQKEIDDTAARLNDALLEIRLIPDSSLLDPAFSVE